MTAEKKIEAETPGAGDEKTTHKIIERKDDFGYQIRKSVEPKKPTNPPRGGSSVSPPPKKTSAKAVSVALADALREVPLSQLAPNPYNPRRLIAEGPAFQELVESIRKVGVLQPILVRPREAGGFEILSGERRFRAAGAAGLKTIPAVVRQVGDPEALAITVTENLHRENLTPLEEARGLGYLLEAKWSATEAAAELGKTVAWVRHRHSLCNLIPAWVEAVEDPKSRFSQWGAAHLELVARMPKEIQGRFLKEWRVRVDHDIDARDRYHEIERDGMVLGVKDLEKVLGEYTRTLRSAPFATDDATLDPKAGACTTCLKRSSRQPELWDLDEADEKAVASKERCLDCECWRRKIQAHLAATEAALRRDHPDLVVLSERGDRTDGRKVERPYAFEHAKAGSKGAVTALYLDGPKAGTVETVRIRKGFEVSSFTPTGSPREAGKPATLAEKRKRLEARRTALAIEKVRNVLEKSQSGHVVTPTGRSFEYVVTSLVASLQFGIAWRRFAEYSETPETHSPDEAAWRVARDWLKHEIPIVPASCDQHVDEAKRICALIGESWEELLAAATKEVPEPKSWAADAKVEKESQKKPKKNPKKNPNVCDRDCSNCATQCDGKIALKRALAEADHE